MNGPKGMLAEAIANALAEFFVVDKSVMETKLFTNAGITLHDTQLKPQHVAISPNLDADITGLVECVAFEWHWGHSEKGGSDWVKDAKLTISGLKFAAVLSQGEEGTPSQNSSAAEKEQEQKKKKVKGFMAYVQDQVERIMDTLTLTVKDFEFSITLPDGESSLIMGGSGLDLQSLGRVEGEPLEEELKIGSLFSSILVDDHLYPLLDPIGYKTSCVRTIGKRFVGGFHTGLTVMGESGDDGIVFHAGAEQIIFVNEMLGVMLLAKPEAGSKVSEEEMSVSSHNSPDEVENDGDAYSSDNKSSIFELPLSAVSVVFPNDTKISLSGLVAKYQMDGSILRLEGHNGILVNDFNFISLGEGSLWCADVLTSQFTISNSVPGSKLETSHHDEIVAFLHARDEEIQAAKAGFDQALAIFGSLQDGGVAVLANSDGLPPPEPVTKESSTKSWSIELQGQLSILWEGSDNDVGAEFMVRDVKASVDDMSVKITAVQKLYIPGKIRLSKPIVDTVLNFNGSVFDIKMGHIVATLEEPPESNLLPPTPLSQTDKTAPPSDKLSSLAMSATSTGTVDSHTDCVNVPYVLPFGVKAVIEQITLYKPDSEEKHTVVKELRVAVGPNNALEIDSDDAGGVRVALMVSHIAHDLITVDKPRLSAVLYFDDLDTIPQFNFDAKSIAIAAGYTALDWKRLVSPVRRKEIRLKKSKQQKQKKIQANKQSEKPLNLPFSHVEPLKIRIEVSSDLVGFKASTLHIGAFNGKIDTTVEDLIHFYSQRVMTKAPNLIANAEIFGTNAADTGVGYLGSATMSAAGPFGGLLGIAAFDGVKNTIQAGKESRGVEPDDKMKFFDLARGLKHAAVHATKEGAKARGKTGDQKGDPLDWAVGATSDVANYTSDNKSRLGAAGAGTVGFMYGMALGGPIGAVAGAVVASGLTGKTIDSLENVVSKKKKKKPTIEASKEEVEEGQKSDRKSANLFETGLSESPILSRGILLKRRDYFVWDWRSHYFYLDDDVLKYVALTDKAAEKSEAGKQDTEGVLHVNGSNPPLKTLKLRGLLVKADDALSKPTENLFVFTIKSTEKILWVLATASEETRKDWTSRLSSACNP